MDTAHLKSIGVFSALDAVTLADLALVVEGRELKEGDLVFTEGDPGNTMFCVVEGVVRIEKRINAEDSGTKTLSILTRGEVFGEMSMIDSKPRSASAVAAEPTRLVCLSRFAFEGLLARNQHSALGLLFSLMRAMNERIRRLNTSVITYDEIGRAIGSAEQLQPLLDFVLKQLVPAVGAERGLVFLKSEFHGVYEPRSAIGVSLSSVSVERPGDHSGIVARVIEKPSSWMIGDRATDSRCSGTTSRGWESPAMLLSQVRGAAGVMGLLVMGHSQPGRFDLNHLNLLDGVARQTGQAILNLRHREEQQSRARLGRQFVRF
ncbi:MAG TPA: cyclic nucleotide-binding domain-containing protein [Verrucomicrobiota bacterium]|nr:hypothetical protein [Verrucomicrobiales bacterium]HRI13954.1 cyclic nucleotide-binding domain-containing protein [Verrucomicrobiota bacterium]